MPTEEEIAALLEQYYAEEQEKYGVPDDFPVDNLTADPALSIPLGGGSSVNPTLGFQNGMVVPGVAVQGGKRYGYANAEFNKMGPQAVNAGISGDRFNVDANIPLSNPAGVNLRGEIDLLPPEKKDALAAVLELSPEDARYYLGLRYSY
jgi:hypothetical protein|tara:strand:- start:394 stop:840 length:447 start_codon:yes stop_codon:yes gene_type:complete